MLPAGDFPDRTLMNPLTLAFIGDGVYELLARNEVLRRYTSLSPKKLHALTVELVRASAQSAGFRRIEGLLSEQELAIFKRGRNATGVAPPRHSSAAEYRTATGLETLFGWLYLGGELPRLQQLFALILEEDALEILDDAPLLPQA